MITTAFLHIGHGKTGSTAIQRTFADHRATLDARGYLYPRSPGRTNHVLANAFVRSDESLTAAPLWTGLSRRFASPAAARHHFREAFLTELAAHRAHHVIVSNEVLWQFDLAPLYALIAAHAPSVRLILYVRRQDRFIISHYKQMVKGNGATLTLREHMAADAPLRRYHDRALAILRACPGAELVVRPYDRRAFPHGSVVHDFNEAVGAALRPDEIDATAAAAHANPSLDAHTTEWLRRRNARGMPSPPNLVEALVAISDGPDLTLAPSEMAHYLALFRTQNERLVADFMPQAHTFLDEPAAAPRGISQEAVSEADLSRVDERLAARLDAAD